MIAMTCSNLEVTKSIKTRVLVKHMMLLKERVLRIGWLHTIGRALALVLFIPPPVGTFIELLAKCKTSKQYMYREVGPFIHGMAH